MREQQSLVWLAVLSPWLWLIGFHVVCFGWWWGCRPHAVGKGTDLTSLPGSSEPGRLQVFVVRPTNRTTMTPFLRWVRRRIETHTRLAASKCFELRRYSPKECVRRQSKNPPLPERLRVWGYGFLRLKDVGISREMRILGLPGSSVRQPPPTFNKPRHTWLDPSTSENGRPKSVLVQRPSKHGQHEERIRTIRHSAMLYHALKPNSVYLSLLPTRHDLTQGQKPEGRLKYALKPNSEKDRSLAGFLIAAYCVYIVSATATMLGRVKGLLYTGSFFIK